MFCIFLVYPTITLAHLYHIDTFSPSLNPPNLGLNQTTPNPLAGRSQSGNMGKKKGNFLLFFEFSVRNNSVNRSLHNCMITEVKTLTKTKQFTEISSLKTMIKYLNCRIIYIGSCQCYCQQHYYVQFHNGSQGWGW